MAKSNDYNGVSEPDTAIDTKIDCYDSTNVICLYVTIVESSSCSEQAYTKYK